MLKAPCLISRKKGRGTGRRGRKGEKKDKEDEEESFAVKRDQSVSVPPPVPLPIKLAWHGRCLQFLTGTMRDSGVAGSLEPILKTTGLYNLSPWVVLPFPALGLKTCSRQPYKAESWAEVPGHWHPQTLERLVFWGGWSSLSWHMHVSFLTCAFASSSDYAYQHPCVKG